MKAPVRRNGDSSTVLITALLTASVLITSLLAGCSSSAKHLKASLSVTPGTALFDGPLTTTLHGLPANTLVTVSASAPASNHTVWSSSAEYRSDANGTVSLSQEALDGSYAGVNPMGLYVSLEPPPTSSDGNYVPPEQGYDITVRASVGGRQVAQAVVHRQTPTTLGVTKHDLRVASDGVYGELFRPAGNVTDKPAILLFGGSEGGLVGGVQREAAVLAAHGYPTLAIAYFAEPGLPAKLVNVPLEYFAKALTLLRNQPGVDPKRLTIFGVSRGGEAALLVGSTYPNLVHGVIAGVPSSVVVPSPMLSPPTAAWTLGGRPLPHISFADHDNPDPPDNQAAVIKVERITGPILLSCGGDDTLWPSCPYVNAITARLKRYHFHYPVTALQYPDGGHFAGDFSALPTMTVTTLGLDGGTGGSVYSDEIANLDSYPKLLAYLAKL